MNQRIKDLLDLVAEEGISLPYPPQVIADLEAGGAIVDLRTGLITPNGDEQRVRLTVIGEAVAVAHAAGAADL